MFVALMNTPESRACAMSSPPSAPPASCPTCPTTRRCARSRKVGVIGAGTMGGGITMNFLNAGIPVVLLEMKQEALDKGLATIRRNYENSAEEGQAQARAGGAAHGAASRGTLDYAGFADADLVIEAVFENMDVKQQVFRQLDEVCKPGAILASNTSYLDLNRIAGFTKRPQDVIGLHFFSPANVMRLLEIVRGDKTAPDVLATCMALAKKIRKVAVVSGVCDGFIGNRMLARYGAAATGLVDAGASPQQVDNALQKFGLAMGPFRMGDLAGLDIGWATRKRRAAEAGVEMKPVVADLLCEAGRFGQKTGAGWYRYEAGKRDPIPDPLTDKLITDYRLRPASRRARSATSEIVERCMYALVNEGARILEEGIAARASDIDLVYLNGYGHPLHRGGPMLYADTVGLPNVVRSLRRFAAEPGADPSWQPAPLLVQAGRGRQDLQLKRCPTRSTTCPLTRRPSCCSCCCTATASGPKAMQPLAACAGRRISAGRGAVPAGAAPADDAPADSNEKRSAAGSISRTPASPTTTVPSASQRHCPRSSRRSARCSSVMRWVGNAPRWPASRKVRSSRSKRCSASRSSPGACSHSAAATPTPPEHAPADTTLHLLHGLADSIVPCGTVVDSAKRLVLLGADITADVLPGIEPRTASRN